MSKNFKKYFLVVPFVYLFIVYISNSSFVLQRMDFYAELFAETLFGHQNLKDDYTKIIQDVMQEMDIKENIKLKRMNSTAMIVYGYNNAVSFFPAIFGVPLNKPYIFVSEGFFEGLSYEEQRFIIGHELIHIRDKHAYYALVAYCFLMLFLLAICLNIRNKNYMFVSFAFVVLVMNLGYSCYQRYYEGLADILSMEILNSQSGCLKLIDRWQKDFNMPEDFKNLRERCFADHPSLKQRRIFAGNNLEVNHVDQ